LAEKQDPLQKKKKERKKERKRAGGVAQVVECLPAWQVQGLYFKPQYHK
jgi:hypothetical protein